MVAKTYKNSYHIEMHLIPLIQCKMFYQITNITFKIMVQKNLIQIQKLNDC